MNKTTSIFTGLILITLMLTGCGSKDRVVVAPNMGGQPMINPTNNKVSSDGTNSTSVTITPPTANAVGGVGAGSTPSTTSNNPSTQHSSGSTSSTTVSTSASGGKIGAKSVTGASFISTSTGFVSGNDGIYKTTNGGKTWAKIYASSVPVLGLQAKYQPVGGEEYVLAYTQTGLLESTNGHSFMYEKLGQGTNNLQGVSLLDNGVAYVLNNGQVWASDPMNGSFSIQTPPENVTSIAMTADDIGYAATVNTVYKTTDHGHHWSKVFTADLSNAAWKTRMDANGSHVAVQYYGGEAGMSQTAYILYESNDAGKTWNALVDEGYFSPDYGDARLLSKTDAGEQPGPLALLESGEVLMTGLVNSGEATYLTGILPDGQTAVHKAVNATASGTDVFDFYTSPLSITAVDAQHIWVAGTKNGRAVIMASQNGGLTWSQ